MTQQSEKLLAITTQLIDYTKIKKIPYITHSNGQIQSINNDDIYITIKDKKITAELPEIAEINI
jgi:alpha-N-acetylglucosamine transferase